LLKKKFLWKIIALISLLVIFPLIFLSVYFYNVLHDSLLEQEIANLKHTSFLIKEKIEVSELNEEQFQNFVKREDNLSNTRLTIIFPNGKVIADSRENPDVMDNHSDRPEIKTALEGNSGYSKRYSNTLKEEYIYFALPLYNQEGKISYVIRFGKSLVSLQNSLKSLNTALIFSVIFLTFLTVVIAYFILINFYKPIQQISLAAESFSQGNFSPKIYPPDDEDLKRLTNSLNLMANQLYEKLDIIGEQTNLQNAVLLSMKEGIVAVDYDENILLMNQTACDILNISCENIQGKALQEVIRVSEIQKFFKKLLEEGSPQEAEILIQHQKDKFLQLSGTILYDNNNNALGALVVFNDISNLKHLDTLKKDLVANVSHELRTPVTTIKGFIETLKEGAIEDPKNAQRFLNIISKHIDRLNLLIDDLLTLAKLEESKAEYQKEEENIRIILESVAEDYEFKASEKKIKIKINCDENLIALINKHLIEQAIGNLVDNAIKYSDKKSEIELGSSIENNNLIIYVKDSGYGISEDHIPRLFERFYRIDKGRSREEGGTGLGLAIVKHIVNSLEGTIEVQSKVGFGSTFIMKIPQ
jgi:two-component system phosphate regulon sensor histidine kinase PhoR